MVGGVASATLSIELRQFAETAPDILRIASETDKEAFGAVILRTSSITVSIRGLLTSTVHYQYPWPPDSSPAPAFNDALMMLAMIINRLGRYDVSARLFSEYGANSSVIHSEELIATVAGVLIRTHRLGDAIRILESLDGRDAFDQMLVALSISWIGRPQALTDQERTEVTDYLLRKADRDEEHADPRQAAISRYNLANRLRTLGDHKRAIAQYERAAELDPSYEERPYFSGDLAGSLFESGRYLDAVQRYQIAVDGGARERYLPLLADALLMAGRYKLAAEAFEHVLNETIASRNPSEWSLKALIAGTITDSIADEQARDTERAHQLALLPDDTPDDEALQRSTQALEADALCPEAWFNLAIVRMRRDEAEAAFIAFSASAVLSRTHFFAFAMAIILGLDLQERLVGDLVRTAYFFGGSDFIRFLGEELEGPSPEDRAALLNAVDSILETAGPREGGRSVELRFLEDDGTVHSMHVGLE